MIFSKNKKFLYPLGSRLWYVYKRYGSAGDKRVWTSWRVNAKKISAWETCNQKEDGWCTKDACIAGGMIPRLGGSRHCIVCGPDEKYVTESQLRAMVENGEIHNSRLQSGYYRWNRTHLNSPKVWKGYKSQ